MSGLWALTLLELRTFARDRAMLMMAVGTLITVALVAPGLQFFEDSPVQEVAQTDVWAAEPICDPDPPTLSFERTMSCTLPKSISRARPCGSTIRFLGEMSRWTTGGLRACR